MTKMVTVPEKTLEALLLNADLLTAGMSHNHLVQQQIGELWAYIPDSSFAPGSDWAEEDGDHLVGLLPTN